MADDGCFDSMDTIRDNLKEGKVLLTKAIFNARRAFEETFEKEGLDCAYFELDLVAWELNNIFEPMNRTEDLDYSSGTRDINTGKWKVNKDEGV